MNARHQSRCKLLSYRLQRVFAANKAHEKRLEALKLTAVASADGTITLNFGASVDEGIGIGATYSDSLTGEKQDALLGNSPTRQSARCSGTYRPFFATLPT